MPVSALASETDECADAGLISSLLGQCGLLGELLGGSDPVDQDPDAVDTTGPDDDGPAGTDDSGGPSSDSPGSSTGPDDSGGTSRPASGSSSDPADSTGSGSHGVPTAGTAGTSDETSVTVTRPVGPPSARISDSGAAGGAGRAQSGGTVEPAQVVGPLSELPDPPQVVGQVEELSEAAGIPPVAESTGPVIGVALTLITAGIFVAITGLWTAIWRNAGRADA
jgi:hypothetical protein